MTDFPNIGNKGHAEAQGARVTYTYIDSYSRAKTVTRPILTADGVIRLLNQRMKHFGEASPGARESEATRANRKYIAAQPLTVLRAAWREMDPDQQKEFQNMLDKISYSGISDQKWAEQNQKPTKTIIGDDETPLV